MTNESHLWNAKPSALRQPELGEHIWSLPRTADRLIASFASESYGWECQCLHDGDLAYGRRFLLKEGALEEAAAQRQRLIGEGCPPAPSPDTAGALASLRAYLSAALSWAVSHAKGRVTQSIRSAVAAAIYEFATPTG